MLYTVLEDGSHSTVATSLAPIIPMKSTLFFFHEALVMHTSLSRNSKRGLTGVSDSTSSSNNSISSHEESSGSNSGKCC